MSSAIDGRADHARGELQRFADLWHLVPDGSPFRTQTSWLQPVRLADTPAILKVAFEDEERRGAALMSWWRADGAAPVLALEGDGLLLERAVDTVSLAELTRRGRDDEASRVLCAVAARLHAPRAWPSPELVPLKRWFRELTPAARRHGGVLLRAAAAAEELLGDPREVRVLHSDIHHGNVLDFGPRGWLAIDPKALVGERYLVSRAELNGVVSAELLGVLDHLRLRCSGSARSRRSPGSHEPTRRLPSKSGGVHWSGGFVLSG